MIVLSILFGLSLHQMAPEDCSNFLPVALFSDLRLLATYLPVKELSWQLGVGG